MTHPTQSNRDDASTPPDRETVARVIDDFVDLQYSIRLTRLVDGVSTYSLDIDGWGYEEFSSHEDAAEKLREVRSDMRADAILALFATPSGYVLVPREATMPMLVAATSRDQGPDDSLYASIYRAMIQAALRGRGEGGAGEDQGASVDRVQAAPDGATGSGGVAGDGGLYPWLREPFRRHAHYIRAALSTYDGTAAADDVEAAWSAIVSVIPAEDWRSVSDPPEDGAWVFLYWPTMPIHFYPAVGFLDGGGWELTALREYGQVFPTHWCSMIAVPQPPRPAKTSAGQPSEASTAAPAPDAPISLPSPNDHGEPTPGPTTRGDG